MEHRGISIRAFIGAKDYDRSRNFYADLGFEEIVLSHHMSYFKSGDLGFYLQRAYVKDWIDNTMVFMEVDDLDRFFSELLTLNLTDKYPEVKIHPPKKMDWGSECFVHDPSGVLWHFGSFHKVTK